MAETETQPLDPPTPVAKQVPRAKYNKMAAQAATYLSSRMFGASDNGTASTKYLMKNLPTVVSMNQIAFLDLGQRIVRACANAIEKKADPADKASMIKSVAVLMETMQRACDALDNKTNPPENPVNPVKTAPDTNGGSLFPPLATKPDRVPHGVNGEGDREF